MDPNAQLRIRCLLDRGESLLWAGIPRQGLLLRGADLYLVPVSVTWGAFSIYWEASVLADGGPLFFAWWGVPFVVLGVHLIVGRFFVDAWAFEQIPDARDVYAQVLRAQRDAT